MKKQSILFLCLTLSTILSAQVSKTVNCTAGALSSLLSSTEKSTITDLTLTGTIDARDFVIMRDNMPKLANIDMGTATIAAYQNNLDNQIPAGAFCDTVNKVSDTIITSIVMPTSTTSIGYRAFERCTGLSGTLVIPNSVTTIRSQAFYECTGLTGTITIPNSVNIIGDYIFQFCTGLTSILVDSKNPNFSSDNGILYNKEKTILIKCPEGKSGTLTIPNSVMIIGNLAFCNCTKLTGDLTIPNAVTSIRYAGFYNCNGFTGTLTIPNSLTSIGESAFSGCSGFNGNLTISNSVTTIGRNAFFGCSGFTGDLTIPNAVTNIGSGAFCNLTGLTSITAQAVKPVDLSNSAYVFAGIDTSTCVLYVLKGSKTAYQNANQWKYLTNIVEYDLPTDNNDITSDGTSLYITDSQLHIKNATLSETVSITAISGMPIYSGIITTDVVSVSLPMSGVYIFTIGNKSLKVVY